MSSLPDHDEVMAAQARIGSRVRETPLLCSGELDAAAGARILVKAECLQETGSFKIRGATNRLAQIPDRDRARGVVAFSSGNHARGVARAARHFGMQARIVMPQDAPRVKIEGVRADGAQIRLYDRNRENREAIAAELARAHGAVLVPSFDDRDIIAGQGTLGLEIARQAEAAGARPDHVLCCTGGGGLITGIALALEGERGAPAPRLWSVEPMGHDDWARSLETGRLCTNDAGTRSICDAILTPSPGKLTWAVGRTRLAGGLRVSDAHVCAAMRFAFETLKLVVEPGGAVALAAALRGLPAIMRDQCVVIVLTGGNVDRETHARAFDTQA